MKTYSVKIPLQNELSKKTAYGSVVHNELSDSKSSFKISCLLFLLIAGILCIASRFYYVDVFLESNVVHSKKDVTLPLCVKGSVGVNLDNGLVTFGGKSTGAYFSNDILYFDFSNKNNKYIWKRLNSNTNNESNDVFFNHHNPLGRWKSSGIKYKHYLIVYGGSSQYNSASNNNDMWLFNFKTLEWNLIVVNNNSTLRLKRWPSVRGHCMAVNNDMIYLFGGKSILRQDENWLWSFNITEHIIEGFLNGWVNITDSSYNESNIEVPSPRHASICDIINNKFVLFGGRHGRTKNGSFVYYNDLWEFDLHKKKWSKFKQEHENNNGKHKNEYKYLWPTPRGHGASVVQNNKLIVFGGHDNDKVFSQVWALDFNNYKWNQLKAIPKNGRYLHVVVNGVKHPKNSHNGMLLFGGQSNLPSQCGHNDLRNDILFYDYDHNQWEILTQNQCNKAKKQYHLHKTQSKKSQDPKCNKKNTKNAKNHIEQIQPNNHSNHDYDYDDDYYDQEYQY